MHNFTALEQSQPFILVPEKFASGALTTQKMRSRSSVASAMQSGFTSASMQETKSRGGNKATSRFICESSLALATSREQESVLSPCCPSFLRPDLFNQFKF
eukprot:g24331.t1